MKRTTEPADPGRRRACVVFGALGAGAVAAIGARAATADPADFRLAPWPAGGAAPDFRLTDAEGRPR
jgi:hypothetical protein